MLFFLYFVCVVYLHDRQSSTWFIDIGDITIFLLKPEKSEEKIYSSKPNGNQQLHIWNQSRFELLSIYRRWFRFICHNFSELFQDSFTFMSIKRQNVNKSSNEFSTFLNQTFFFKFLKFPNFFFYPTTLKKSLKKNYSSYQHAVFSIIKKKVKFFFLKISVESA